MLRNPFGRDADDSSWSDEPTTANESGGTGSKTVKQAATGRLDMRGSVHASGECYVTINRCHRLTKSELPFQAKGSVHKQGHSDVTIREECGLSESDVPRPAEEPRGFASLVKDDLRLYQSSVTIGSLILAPDASPERIKGLAQSADYYDEISLCANVHSPGELTVEIDDLYVIE